MLPVASIVNGVIEFCSKPEVCSLPGD